MAKIIDLTGKTFGRWTVSKLSHQVGKVLYWSCVCECGTERAVFGADLKRGGSKSCGCLMRELRSVRSTKHGMAHHPAYTSWQGADQRCNNPKSDGYYLYGGRGIKLCDRWKSDFAAFWEDMGPTWVKGASLDRIDPDGDYCPENCRWATPKGQANNRRDNRIIETLDGPMTVTQAAEMVGLNPKTVHSRIRYGWNDHELLAPPRRW